MAEMERYISESGGEVFAEQIKKRAVVRELTQAEYDALSDAEKNNGTVYVVTDDVTPIKIPTKTSDLTNDSDFQTGEQVDAKIVEELSGFDKVGYKIADAKPTATTVIIDGEEQTTQEGVRYLVKHETDSKYEEYILVDGEVYDIGSTGDIDLSGYAKTKDIPVIDSELSKTSENGLQNKVIAEKFEQIGNENTVGYQFYWNLEKRALMIRDKLTGVEQAVVFTGIATLSDIGNRS